MKINLVLVYILVVIDVTIGTLLGPFIPAIFANLPGSTLLLQWSFAVFVFFQAISGPILGYLSDQFGRKPIFLLTAVATFLSQGWLWPLKASLVFVNRLSDGLTNGMAGMAKSAVTDMSKKEDVIRNSGLMDTIGGLGVILGPAVAGIILAVFPVEGKDQVRVVIYAAVFLAIINIIVASLFKETLKTHVNKLDFSKLKLAVAETVSPRIILKRLLAIKKDNPALALIIVMQSLITMSVGYYMYLMSYLTSGPISLTPKEMNNFFLFIGLAILVFNLIFFGFFIKRIKPEKLINYSLFTGIFAVAMYAFLPANITYFYAWLAVDFLTYGFAFGVIGGMLASKTDDATRGQVLGLSGGLSALSAFLTSIVAGLLSLIDMRLPFAWFTLCVVAVFVLWTKYKRIIIDR